MDSVWILQWVDWGGEEETLGHRIWSAPSLFCCVRSHVICSIWSLYQGQAQAHSWFISLPCLDKPAPPHWLSAWWHDTLHCTPSESFDFGLSLVTTETTPICTADSHGLRTTDKAFFKAWLTWIIGLQPQNKPITYGSWTIDKSLMWKSNLQFYFRDFISLNALFGFLFLTQSEIPFLLINELIAFTIIDMFGFISLILFCIVFCFHLHISLKISLLSLYYTPSTMNKGQVLPPWN